MGLHRRNQSRPWQTKEAQKHRTGLVAIVATQHVLLWTSAYIVASEAYLLIEHHVTPDLLPTSVILLVSVGHCVPRKVGSALTSDTKAALSFVHILTHNASALLSSRAHAEREDSSKLVLQWIAMTSLRFGVTCWLAACGMNIMFTIARRPYCVSKGSADVADVEVGSTCIIQRTGVGASLLSL